MKRFVETILWTAALFLGTSAIVAAGLTTTPSLLRQGADERGVLSQKINQSVHDSLTLEAGGQRDAALKEAETNLRQILEVSDSALYRRQLGTVLELQNRLGEALIEYALGHLVDADELPLQRQREAGAEALTLLRESERYKTDAQYKAEATFAAAIHADQFDAARSAVEVMSSKVGPDELAWMQSQIEERSGNLEQARGLWKQTLSFNSRHLDAAEKTSLAAGTTQEHEEALRIIEGVLEEHQQHPRFWYYRARHHAALGDLKRSLDAMENAWERGRWSALYGHALADLLEQDGQLLRAKKIRREAQERDPEFNPQFFRVSKIQ
jgi:tetratricopeptide (TPR) repeat protein